MNRRHLLGASIGGTLFGTSGCIDSSEGTIDGGQEGEPTDSEEGAREVIADEPQLSPGEDTILQIETDDVSSIAVRAREDTGLRSFGDKSMVELNIDYATLSPGPDGQLDSFPPTWEWDTPTDVKVEVPVHVADEAEPGEYPYAVTVTHDGEGNTFKFSIIITRD